MSCRRVLASLVTLAASANAWGAPGYDGFSLIWQDSFGGSSGQLPNEGNWNIITGDLGVNNEQQVYTRNSANVQLSGGDTLQIVPWRDSSAVRGWTSGRLESKYVLTPAAGELTRVEAVLRFGDNAQANKQGIWPAWWSLGDSIRNGVAWPACGELDIMEQVNGELIGHGTVHCDVYPGGICNEGNGLGEAIGMPDLSWHTWRLELDRRSGNFADQAITWFMDGQQFHQITGSSIGNANVWASLCQSPIYFLLNVAVGGNWVS